MGGRGAHDAAPLNDARAASRTASTPASVAGALRRDVYASRDLSEYTRAQRLTICVASRVFHGLIAALCRTLRWRVEGWSHHDAVQAAGERYIAAFWHDRIVLATWFWRRRGIVVMTSRSFDGEYIARFIQQFGYGAARGSSSRGGQHALDQMAACLANGMSTAFTMDGPRGPRYVAKHGAVRLAALSGQPILPFCVSARRTWTVPSWDRMQIPWPFNRAVLLVGEPIRIAPDARPEALEAAHAQLQDALDRLRERGDRWWEADPDGPQHAEPRGPATKENVPWQLDGLGPARTATHPSHTSRA